MGKATIYAHLGDGKYSILYTPEVAESAARIAELEALKTALDAQLYSANGLVNAQAAEQAVYDAASDEFELALDDWAACAMQLPPCQDQAALIAAVAAKGAARAEAGMALNTIKAAISANRSEYFSTTQEIAYLTNTQKGGGAGVMEAWCIDNDPAATIPASTVVGTVETFGAKSGYAGGYLPRKWINIQSSAAPAYSASRDHCVKSVSGIKTAAMFFNWCQWLYVMSRNPQHAVGTVLSKFNDMQSWLDVELYGTTPGAFQPGGYPFDGGNKVTLLNVPVEYLDCGAEIFEPGDHVIVRFSGINRANPTVIGFAESPRQCLDCATTFIYPWHGIAVDTILITQDEATKIVTQPSDGDVVPFVSASNPTALFSGSERVHCGTSALGTDRKWVWESSPTQKYIVTLEAFPYFTVASYSASAVCNVEISLAEVGGTGAFNFTITPTLAGDWTDAFDTAYPLTSNLQVVDVSSDGAKAILAGTRRSQSKKESQRGFFLLTLTSVSSATLAVLADHIECNPQTFASVYSDVPSSGYENVFYDLVPVWMWFKNDDTVERVDLNIHFNDLKGTPFTDIYLSVGGVVKSRLRAFWQNAANFDGYTTRLFGLNPQMIMANETGTGIVYVGDMPIWNCRRWYSTIPNFYTGVPGLAGEDTDVAQVRIDVIVFSNKSVGLKLSAYRIKYGPTSYRLTDTYYGEIVHPSGPADPGTKMGTRKTASFIADLSATTMTVTSVTNGTLAVGARIDISGYASFYIVAFGTGTGLTGTYTVSQSFTPVTGKTALATYVAAPFIDYMPESGVIHAAVESGSMTGYIDGTTLTITAVALGTISIGAVLSSGLIASGTTVIGFGTGTGLIGTYTVSISHSTIPSQTITIANTDKPFTTYQPITGQLVRNQSSPVCFF